MNEKVTYILKLRNTNLYLKNYNSERIYTDNRANAYQFDAEKPTHEKYWEEINSKGDHVLIKRTEVTSVEYMEVDI